MMKGKKTQKTIRSYAPHLAAAAFVMVLVTVLALFAPAYAATSGEVKGLSDETIGLSYSGDADEPWRVEVVDDKQQIIGSAKGKSGRCGDTHYESTLTITNNKSTPATLSFDYVIEQNDGTIQVDGIAVTKDGPFSKELTANGSIKIYIKSGSTSKATKITIKNILLVYETKATTTFLPADDAMMGSYSVDGTAVTEIIEKTQESSKAYELVAKPKDDYRFMGWYDATEGEYIGIENPYSLRSENDRKITAKFTKKGAAIFAVGKQYFDDLNNAVKYAEGNAKSTVTLVSDGTLAAGDYTISSGITLLIPFDAAGTLYTATPEAITAKTEPTPFRTLTLASGAKITVNGAISVGGRYYAAAGGGAGQMTGPYGWIKLEKGSGITVESGGNLYAWGFVSGEGSVTANSGGTVYEWFQIMDFRGGTAILAMRNKVFPISQYAVQNIEASLTIQAGASEIAYSGIYFNGGISNPTLKFITSDGMFNVVNGSLTKKYDRTTDRMIYTVDGQAELNHVSMEIYIDIDSAKYVLPLTNNMTVHITSGSKLAINYDTALLPGVEVNVAEDAKLVVASGKNMYIYDSAEWGKYACYNEFVPVKYVSDNNKNRKPRTTADLKDAKVDVNGTVTATGNIYTTKSGADICSTAGTGKFVQESATTKGTTTYQYTQVKSTVTSHDIVCNPAQLHNADGTYTETSTVSAGTTISYVDGRWTEAATVKFVGNDGTASDESLLTQTVDLLKENATVNCPIFEKAGYKFLGFAKTQGATTADFSVGDAAALQISVSALGAKTGETVTLYAVYEAEFRTVTWNVTGVTGVTVNPTQVDPTVSMLTKTVKELFGDSARYLIRDCAVTVGTATATHTTDSVTLDKITSDITVTLELVAYDHIVTVKDGTASTKYYVADKGNADVLTGKSVGYKVTGQNVISGVTVSPNGKAAASHTATTATITNIIDNVTVTVALEAYDYLVTIKAGGSSETHYVKGDKDVLTNAAITYTAGDKKVITNVTGHTATLTRGEGDVNAYVTDGWKSFTLSGIKEDQTVAVTLKDYAHTVDWTRVEDNKGSVITTTRREYVAEDESATLKLSEGFRATGVTGAGGATVTGIGAGAVTISSITKDLTVTVTARNYSYAVTWNVNDTESKEYLDFDKTTATYTATGADTVIISASVTPEGVATVTRTNTKVTVTGISSDVTVHVTTEEPTTELATYYFGDMSYEYKRNTVLYQWDGKSKDKGQWIPVDSFAWQHKAGSRIYEFEDENLEAIVVPNGSVLLVNGSNQTMQYTVTYTPDGELTNAVMTFTAGEETGKNNTLSVVLKPGKQAMVSSTFACDVSDQKLTNAAAGQVTVTTEPYNN